MHIIHLEDCTRDAELANAMIMAAWPHCQISVRTNGREFEESVLAGSFDLVLSDYTLPGYDGLRALAFVRAYYPDRPFIYLSGTIGEERAIEALKAGATDYVLKDRMARLPLAIQAALDQNSREQARRRAEEKVREQASLLDLAKEAILTTDANLVVTYWNASAEHLYGWTADEACGRMLRELLYTQDLARFDAARAEVQDMQRWRGRLQPITRNGQTLMIESSWSAVRHPNGEIRAFFIIDSDVTERLQQEALRQAAQRLETIGLLAGGIAHDLNNALAPILSSVDLLRERSRDPNDQDILDVLEKSAEHGVELVRQLVSFAKGGDSQKSELRVAALVTGVRRFLQHAVAHGVDLVIDVEPEPSPIEADGTQIRQLLLNLCINARDAMPDGGTVTVRAKDVIVDPEQIQPLDGEARVGRYVCISVADTGTGIPPEIVSKICQPFFTTKAVGKGTGLGLSNVAGIVKAHGGFLTLQTAVGTGTTFRLYFPALERMHKANGKMLEIGGQSGHGERILVIEDDNAVRAVIEVILQTHNYRVISASGGRQGIQRLRAEASEIDAVLTDISMPDVSGLQVVKELSTLANAPSLLVMSGLSREFHDSPLLTTVEFLQKPLTAKMILDAVRKVLDQRAARRDSST